MQRFYPTPRPDTLSDKAIEDLRQKRFMPVGKTQREVRIAAVLGMDDEARQSLARLISLSKTQQVGIAGRLMPDSQVSRKLAAMGIVEEVDRADLFRYRVIGIPYVGISPKQRREWEESGIKLEDFTSPQVRRAQVALGLLRMEGAQGLVVGSHEEPETQAICGGSVATPILQDTTDTARLRFAPAFGVVCQTRLSPRRVAWLVQQLRYRWRDSRVTFLNTLSAAMQAREQALEKILSDCERVIVMGDKGESSCEALVETALLRGKTATVIADPTELDLADFPAGEKIALTAGAFVEAERVREIAEILIGS